MAKLSGGKRKVLVDGNEETQEMELNAKGIPVVEDPMSGGKRPTSKDGEAEEMELDSRGVPVDPDQKRAKPTPAPKTPPSPPAVPT